VIHGDRAYPAAFFGAVLVLWEVGVRVLRVPEYLLPAPSASLGRIDMALLGHMLATLEEAALGFVLANLMAFAAAIVFVRVPIVEQCLFPLAVAMKTTPLAALAPLLVIWLGTGLWSKVAAAVLISFFPTLVNGVKGLKTIEPEARELFACYQASVFETFWHLRLPSALPYVLAGLKISTSLAVVGAIVGEFVGAIQGLGYLVLVSSYHMDTPTMFAAVFCAAAIGFAMFWGIGEIERRAIFWQRVEP
jgi:NitT/TauT family transport system permease protein